MSTYLRTRIDIEDFIRGCTFYGVGGGGNPLLGMAKMEAVLAKQGVIELVDPATIGDDEMTCCVFGMGSIAPTVNRPGAYDQYERVAPNPNMAALEELEKMTNCSISAVVAFEPGGVNTSIGLHAGAMLNRKIIDGDYSGRAVPELCQTIPAIYGETITPLAICDDWGNVLHITRTASTASLEGIGKNVSIITKAPDKFAICAHAGMLLPGRKMKEYVIPYTMTKALEVGRTIREANEQGKDAPQMAATAVAGKVIFKGVVDAFTFESSGYMTGETSIQGCKEFDGQSMKIWFKNENHIAWRNGTVVATSPDIIEVVNLENAEPITNTNLREGAQVAVIGAPNPRYRTPQALNYMGPKYFGFDLDYTEIEKIW